MWKNSQTWLSSRRGRVMVRSRGSLFSQVLNCMTWRWRINSIAQSSSLSAARSLATAIERRRSNVQAGCPALRAMLQHDEIAGAQIQRPALIEEFAGSRQIGAHTGRLQVEHLAMHLQPHGRQRHGAAPGQYEM